MVKEKLKKKVLGKKAVKTEKVYSKNTSERCDSFFFLYTPSELACFCTTLLFSDLFFFLLSILDCPSSSNRRYLMIFGRCIIMVLLGLSLPRRFRGHGVCEFFLGIKFALPFAPTMSTYERVLVFSLFFFFFLSSFV